MEILFIFIVALWFIIAITLLGLMDVQPVTNSKYTPLEHHCIRLVLALAWPWALLAGAGAWLYIKARKRVKA